MPSVPPSFAPTRFQVEAELGRGGMGSVERAVDLRTGRTVALKRLRVERADARYERMLSLFEQEYHLLSQLRHPRIIEVYDYGKDAVGPYYTMEVLDGRDLRALAPLPWRDACRIGRDVVSSLAILHGRRFVHRDVTPRNIRVSDDGQAKLLDFGAMCPMGVAAQIAGTPPYVAPEAIQSGALDGRTDLFALGATLYFCLTGRHAYPARQLAQLPDLWRWVVPSPRQLRPEIPAGLSALVMDLLALSPVARPQSAAVVFERLIAIGELPRVEALEVRGAYLTAPTLVGRDTALARCRNGLLKALRGRGRSILISGPEGVGRTRTLDAVVLDAKMLGALVLRVDADGGADYGALRGLVGALRRAAPSHPIESPLLARLSAGERVSMKDRDALLEAFNAWVLGYAQKRRLVIAVDDVHALDEPSLAGIASLASELRGARLFVVSTLDERASVASEAARELLQASSRRVALEPLSATEVRRMLGLVFADADNLDLLSTLLNQRAEGNPGRLMELAQALVDAGAVRYEAGAWVVPATAGELRGALPAARDLAERFAELPPDAREIAGLLALDLHGELSPADCAAVTRHGSQARVLAAIDVLIDAGILTRRARGCVFARGGYGDQLRALLGEAPEPSLHASLAELYAGVGHVPAQAHHAARRGDWDAAERLLLAGDESVMADLWRHEPTAVSTFEAVIAAREREQPPRPSLLSLRCRYLTLCVETEEWLRVVRHGPATVAALAERCGLEDHAALVEVPEAERLGEAIARAEARAGHRAAHYPEDAAGLTLVDALKQLPVVILGTAAAAYLAVEPRIVAELPSLRPFHALSPALPVIDELREAIHTLVRGRPDLALFEMRRLYAELTEGHEDIEPFIRKSLALFSLGFLQGIDGILADPATLERLDLSSARSIKRAERERYVYHVAMGDADLAEATRRRLERLEVQGGSLKHFPTGWECEYSLYALTFDVKGLKRCEQEAERVARDLSGWTPRVELARLAQAQCGTSSEFVLERAGRLRERLAVGSSERRYAFYLESHCLIDLGRHAECKALAEAEMAALGREPRWHDGHVMLAGIAEAYLGLHDEAKLHVERQVEIYLEAGVRGVLLGRAHEYAALVALLGGREEDFREHARACAEQYRSGYNPALTARYETLMRKALELQVEVGGQLAGAAEYSDRTSASELRSLFRTEIATCLDEGTRFQQGLALVARRAKAGGGVLYLLGDGGLRCAASFGEHPPVAEIEGSVREFWEAETRLGQTETVTAMLSGDPAVVGALAPAQSDPGDGAVRLFVLSNGDAEGERACGALVLTAPRDRPLEPDHDALVALAQLMLEEESVLGLPFD